MDTIIAQNNTRDYMEPGFDTTGPWLASKILYESLYNADSILITDSLMNAYVTNMNSTDIGAILQSEIENQYITDSAALTDSKWSSDDLSEAQYLTGLIPDTNVQATNYIAMSNIYLNTLGQGIDTFTNGQLDTITALAIQCPYTAGDAVYIARSLYAHVDNTIFFNDIAICQPIGGEDRIFRIPTTTQDSTVASKEFVHLYPNPAKDLINLSFYAQTTGSVEFELFDQLAQPVMREVLSNGQTFAQFSTNNLSSGLYNWRLMDSQRTIKIGMVAIIK